MDSKMKIYYIKAQCYDMLR